MIIYRDKESKCYITNDGTMTETIAPVIFIGKCPTFIEGYVFIPSETEEINGESYGKGLLYPWKDYDELDTAQREYERTKLIQYENKENELNSSYQEGINSI